MKKAAIALISILVASMMFMAVASVSAKPRMVNVTVKYTNHKPASNLWVDCFFIGPGGGGGGITDSHGKISFVVPETLSPDQETQITVSTKYQGGTVLAEETVYLSNKLSARVTITLTPP